MHSLPNPKESMKAYRKGFMIGAFSGVVVCIFMGKVIWSLPIILGLFLGALAYDINTRNDETER